MKHATEAVAIAKEQLDRVTDEIKELTGETRKLDESEERFLKAASEHLESQKKK